MKKIICALLFIAAGNALNAQSFLNKVKSKIKQIQQPAVSSTAAQAATATVVPADGSFTDPAKYGTLVYTFTGADYKAHQNGDGGYDLWFQTIKVVNNQLQLQMADYSTAVYNYTGGVLVKTDQKPIDDAARNKLSNGSEAEMLSVNFTEMDETNAILLKGPHVSSGAMPGNPNQSFTFRGKTVGSFAMFNIAHNADSSVIAIAGAVFDSGMKYLMVTSNGQKVDLPKQYGAMPLVSPDGKISAAIIGNEAYFTNGTVFKASYPLNNKLWLRNSGSIFNIDLNNNHSIMRNGELFHTFDSEVALGSIFIGPDEKNFCWAGDHALCFSDGTRFENGLSPHKVTIDNKEVVVFLTINLATGQVYLCRHDL